NGAPEVVDIVRRMMREAESVAAAFGVRMPVPTEKRIAGTATIPLHMMSMLQDLERGRPLGIDVLIDSIESMRELVGIETPTVDTVPGAGASAGRRRGTAGLREEMEWQAAS